MRIATVYQTKTRVKRAGRDLEKRGITHKVDDRGSMSKLEIVMPIEWTDDEAVKVIAELMRHQGDQVTFREGTL